MNPAGAGGRETFTPPRLFGVDAARGLALLGMFVAHTVLGGGEKIVDGRSAILFATVAGVSLGLITGGAGLLPHAERATARLVVLVRGAALVLLGLALTAFLRPPVAVILDYYGVGFLVLIGVLFVARPLLAALAAVLTLAAPPVVAAVTGAVPFDDIVAPLQLFARWFLYGEYPMLIWLVFLLVGLVLARSDLGDRFTAALAFVGGVLAAVVGYGATLVLPDVSAAAHTGTTAEVLGSGGVAVAIIGGLSLLDSATGAGERVARIVRFVLSPLAAAGALSLTLYTAHVVVLAVLRTATGGDDRWIVPDATLPSLIIGSLVVAVLWRRFVGTGPLETALRALTRLALRGRRPRVAP